MENTQIQGSNDNNSINKKNIISHLSLVKSFNILNDLKIMNSINDLNIQESVVLSNNNVFNDDKSTNNEKAPIPLKDSNKNELEKDSILLSKKKKREKNNEKYIDIIPQVSGLKTSYCPVSSNDNVNNLNVIDNKNTNNILHVNMQMKIEDNKNEKASINNLIDKINIASKKPNEKNSTCDCNSTVEKNAKSRNNNSEQ